MMKKSSTVGFVVSFVAHAMIVTGIVYSSFTKESVSVAEPKMVKISLANYTPSVKKEVVTPQPKKVEPKPVIKKEIPKPVVKKETPKPEPKIVEEVVIEEVVKEVIEEIIEVAEVEETVDKTNEEVVINQEISQEQPIIETVSQDIETQSINEPTISKTDFEIIRDMVFANVKYPTMAKRMNITGIVELVLVIDSSGKLLEVLLGQSSGNKLLDKSALSAAERLSKSILPNPQYLTRVTLPVAFELN